jgi:hypothetical protein
VVHAKGLKRAKEDRLSQLSFETPACQDMSLGFSTIPQDYWVFALCPSSGILKNITLLGRLERANLNHKANSNLVNIQLKPIKL